MPDWVGEPRLYMKDHARPSEMIAAWSRQKLRNVPRRGAITASVTITEQLRFRPKWKKLK